MHNDVGNETFCFPEKSFPKDVQAPAFPSPSTCLPEEQQEELEAGIKAANALLLNLALSNKQPIEGRRASFEGLIGQWVEVLVVPEPHAVPAEPTPSLLNVDTHTVEKSAAKKTVKKKKIKSMKGPVRGTNPRSALLKRRSSLRYQPKKQPFVPTAKKCKKRVSRKSVSFTQLSGRVHVVGRDFVLLKKKKCDLLIPFSRVHSITSFGRFSQTVQEPALLDIDPCLRQSLMLNFGETVASSPELIQLFFTMNLPFFLLSLLGKKVKIILDEKKITGCLLKMDEETLTIITPSKKEKTIPFPDIQYISI